MNGLYIHVKSSHYYLCSRRKLGEVSDKFDRNMVTTQMAFQFNYYKLADINIRQLGSMKIHQTSGNCIRNISCRSLSTENETEMKTLDYGVNS